MEALTECICTTVSSLIVFCGNEHGNGEPCPQQLLTKYLVISMYCTSTTRIMHTSTSTKWAFGFNIVHCATRCSITLLRPVLSGSVSVFCQAHAGKSATMPLWNMNRQTFNVGSPEDSGHLISSYAVKTFEIHRRQP